MPRSVIPKPIEIPLLLPSIVRSNYTNMSFLLKMSTIVAISLTTLSASAQQFPSINTESPNRSEVNLPTDLSGKKSILFLAFKKEAEEMLDNWYAPVYTMFIDKSGFNAMAYDCHVKLVMMFTGLGQSLSENIMEKIRANVDEEMSDYLLFYQGDFKEHMQDLDLKKKDDAYVFVLDEAGKIIFHDSGRYSESKLEKMADLVEL